VGHTETWPADDVGITNVLVSVHPFLQTKVFSTDILVDVDIGWEDLCLVIWRDKHLSISQVFFGQNGLTLCRAKGARLYTNDPGLASIGGISLDTDDAQLCDYV
jgi:hypothetical protein